MDLIDNIKDIASRVSKQKQHITTEEATKNAFIMPFITALGYDVFNPLEVIPEYTADSGTKKGEKVDYAIKKDGKVIILIECKYQGEQLQKDHVSQLFRYFAVTDARFAILTNGINYEFYSDLDKSNTMDSKPFFEFDILDFEDYQLEELTKFTKPAFSLEDILNTASTLKYTGQIKKILEKELSEPTEEFVRFFAKQIYDGALTKKVIEDFTNIVREARKQFVEEQINERFKSASALSYAETDQTIQDSSQEKALTDKKGIETTQDEIDGHNIIKAILYEIIDIDRVVMRDTKSYCGILLDDNNRKPICRLHFNYSQKYLGFVSNKQEERVAIKNVSEIYKHSDTIKKTIFEYEQTQKNTPADS